MCVHYKMRFIKVRRCVPSTNQSYEYKFLGNTCVAFFFAGFIILQCVSASLLQDRIQWILTRIFFLVFLFFFPMGEIWWNQIVKGPDSVSDDLFIPSSFYIYFLFLWIVFVLYLLVEERGKECLYRSWHLDGFQSPCFVSLNEKRGKRGSGLVEKCSAQRE